MRTPLHTRIFCCWLALLVLLSSTGFGMVEHWCQMRGYTKTLLIAQQDCTKPCQEAAKTIPDTGGPIVKKHPCCKTTLSYQHLDVSNFAVENHPIPVSQPAAFLPNPQFRFLLAALLSPPATEFILPTTDTPLHRTGRYRLASLCTWLI